MGEPSCALHPRKRRGDESCQPQERRRVAVILSQRHSTGCDRRSRNPRAAYLHGEETDSYVIVKGSTPEFDYPKGKDNVYATYNGDGGVAVGAIARRILFAWYFRDVNLLLSSYVTGDSRIMMRRNIQERVRLIAPFLRLDHDPYVVVSDGRLFWMQDAYTTSRYFPYAQSVQDLDLNYIRNSVKVVVDAYNGTVDFYLMDSADPVAAGDPRELACDPDRGLAPPCIAALFAGGTGTLAGTQTGDSCLW
jgi:uncharacterized membrane protein (UPF0182 family)